MMHTMAEPEDMTTPPATTGLPSRNRQRRKPNPKGLRSPLGIFQYLVMRGFAALDKRAYVVEVQDYLTYDIKLAVDTAQVYVTAKRLEDMGHLSTKMVPHPEDAGRSVKMYTITKQGDAAIVATAQLLAAVLEVKGGTNSDARTTKATPRVATSKRVRPRPTTDRS